MQHMVLVPQFTVFWNVQYKVKVPCNFLSLFLPGCYQWSQTFDTEMSYKIYRRWCFLALLCSICEIVKMRSTCIYTDKFICTWCRMYNCVNLKNTFCTCNMYRMYMCVLLYSRCFLKLIFKSALWTYCIQGNIHPIIIFSPLWPSLSAG